MKVVFCLALLCASTFSQAALFSFRTNAVPQENATGWAVDVGTARQWYLAWAGSAERMLNWIRPAPVPNPAPVGTSSLVSQWIPTAILAVFVAALASAAKAVLKTVKAHCVPRRLGLPA